MKIAKTSYKPQVTAVAENGPPANSSDPSSFLDATAVSDASSENSAGGLMATLFGRVANIVDTAGPNQVELKAVAVEVTSNLRDAFSLVTGVVTGEDEQPVVPAPRRLSTSSVGGPKRNLMDIIASGEKDTPAQVKAKSVSSMMKIKQSIKEVLAARSRQSEILKTDDVVGEGPSVELKMETSFVPVSVTDNVREISIAISKMQRAIAGFGRSEVDERPLSPRERDRPRSRSEQLVDEMNRQKAVWKAQNEPAQTTSKKKKSVQEQSAALVKRIEEKMAIIRTKKFNHDGTVVPDVLDSHRGEIPRRRRRYSKLAEIAEIIDVVEADSLTSSQVVSPAASSGELETPRSKIDSKSFVSDDSEIIELPSMTPSPETSKPGNPPKSPRSVLAKAASSTSLGSSPTSSRKAPSESESVSSNPRKWLAISEDVATQVEAPKPVEVTNKPDEDLEGKGASPKPASAKTSPRSALSPMGTARLARRQYCQGCSRIISNRDLDDLLAEGESKKWTTCAACIKSQFHTLTSRINPAGATMRIGSREGEFLEELSGKSSIPIRWVSAGQERVFANALCLVLYELCENKSVLLRNPKESIGYDELQALLDNDIVQLPGDWKSRAPAIMRSVLRMQTEQHPMLRKLIVTIMDRKTTPKFVAAPHPYIPEELGDIWLEIADQVNVDYRGVN